MCIKESFYLLIFGLTVIIFALLPNNALGDGFKLIELREAYIDYRNYAALNPNGRDMLIYPEPPKEGINLTLNTNIFKVFYWDSTIESSTTQGQYRSVGLETRLGVNLTEHLRFGFYHHSQHVLDRGHSYMDKFPVSDAVEIRFYLFRPKEERHSVF